MKTRYADVPAGETFGLLMRWWRKGAQGCECLDDGGDVPHFPPNVMVDYEPDSPAALDALEGGT